MQRFHVRFPSVFHDIAHYLLSNFTRECNYDRIADFPAVVAQAGDVDPVIADDALQRVDYMGNIGNGHFQ